MSSTNEIILEVVCPALGTVLAIFMFLAPVRDLKAAIAKGDLGYLNPSPWGFLLGNCLGSTIYGALLKNIWVFSCNGIGVLFSIWLNLGAVKLLYQGHHAKEMRQAMVTLLEERKKNDEDKCGLLEAEGNLESSNEIQTSSTSMELNVKEAEEDWVSIIYRVTSQVTPAPARHEAVVLFVCTLWMILGSILLFVDTIDIDTKALMVGITTNVILVFFYGAPLSTIFQVLKERNSATIHIPTMINNTLCGAFWCVYGIAIGDVFVYGPNGLGAAFGVIQFFLCVTFPRTTKKTEHQDSMDLTQRTMDMAISSTQLNACPRDVESGTMAPSI